MGFVAQPARLRARQAPRGDQANVAGYDARMPRWLLPWVIPLAVAVAVGLAAISITFTAIALGMVVAIAVAVFAGMRLQYLKRHPPEPELVHKPFWKF